MKKDIFFDLSVELLVILDKDGKIVEMNPTCAEYLNIKPEEAIGKSYRDFVLPDDWERTGAEISKAVTSEKPTICFEIRVLSASDAISWISWNAIAKDGYVYVAGRNITKERRAIEESVKTTLLLRGFVKNAPAAIALFDKELNMVECSEKFLIELVLSETVTNLSLPSIIPFNASELATLHEMAAGERQVFQLEKQIETVGKISLFLDVELSLIRQGNFTGIMCHIYNRTIEKMAIEEVKSKNQKLNGLLENLPVIIFKVNEEGVFTYSQGAGLKSLGMKDFEVVGKKFAEVYPQFGNYCKEAVYGKSGDLLVELEYDKRKVFFQTFYFPDSLGNGMIGFALDVTENIENLRSLEAAKLAAESASIAKSRFLASISHEIRTPLNSVIGFSELLSKQDLSEEQREYVNYIQSSGSILLKLIGDVLDLTQIELGKVSVVEKEFKLKESLSNTLLPYKFAANEKGLFFSLQIDQFIPDFLSGDFDKIRQVLVNLIANALKFTEKGGITVTVNCQSQTERDVLLKFEVSDTGIGISDEQYEKIFELFAQGDNTVKTKFGGSGLGLSISRELVELMGGQLTVESNLAPAGKSGAGSKFSFHLKLKTVEPEKTKVENSISLNSKFQQQIRILVAEDNLMNQKLAEVVLKNLGCVADFADNGEIALEFFKRNKYDLLLMDIQMPVLDGVETTAEIRKTDPNIPIIAVTAHAYKEEIDRFISSGLNDCLAKPYTEKQLFELISRWVLKSKEASF